MIGSCLALKMLRHSPYLQAASELNDSNLSAERNVMQNVNAGSKNHPQPIIQRFAQQTFLKTFSIPLFFNIYLKP